MISRILENISKLTALVYVYFKYKFKKKSDVKNKDILIIFGGHLGNVVIGVNFVLEVRKLFPKNEGWNVYILCNHSLQNTFKTIADMSEFEFLDVDYPNMDGGSTYRTVHNTIRALRHMEFDKILVSLANNMTLARYIVATINSNQSIGVFDDVSHSIGSANDLKSNIRGLKWYFTKAFTDPIYVPIDMQEAVRQKLIIKKLGGNSYQVGIYPIKKLCEYELPGSNYITIAIDSALANKKWETEKFAEVSDYLIEKYGFDVCLTGGMGSEGIYESIMNYIRNVGQIHNFVGKTNFSEWVELIRGSKFHIGVDSGSIHIAASVGTQAFCLIGVWDGERALPYKVEKQKPDTCSPICVYMHGVKNLTCYGCVPKRGKIGSGNPICTANCEENRPYYCLEQIMQGDLIEKIDSWISQ